MALIRLEDTCKLDIPEIDSEHETMIRLVNQIDDAMLQGADRTTLEGLLSQLLESTRSHFIHEEMLMSQFNYPGYETHKTEHNRLRQQLLDFVNRFKNDELLLSYSIVAELKEWAAVHVEKTDKQLGEFLKKQKHAGAGPE